MSGTEHLNRIIQSPNLAQRKQEFYWLWIGAITAYGVGDILTTLTILSGDGPFIEANLLITYLFNAFGQPGFIALKLLAFTIALAVSVAAAEYWQDRLLYYGPPVFLTVVGTIVTANNLHLFLTA